MPQLVADGVDPARVRHTLERTLLSAFMKRRLDRIVR
jgi:hypothetical protein